ncbi:hypothetical protein K1719_036763 [Acacia pycnantha]|nr:hypothetical protein K1719_036763 [Acacia pycnantha]
MRRNKVEGLKDSDGSWVFDQYTLKNLAIKHYKELFKTRNTNVCEIRTRSHFPMLIDAEVGHLQAGVMDEEIRHATLNLGAFKALRPYEIQDVLY